jgi:hypothetical protein
VLDFLEQTRVGRRVLGHRNSPMRSSSHTICGYVTVVKFNEDSFKMQVYKSEFRGMNIYHQYLIKNGPEAFELSLINLPTFLEMSIEDDLSNFKYLNDSLTDLKDNIAIFHYPRGFCWTRII